MSDPPLVDADRDARAEIPTRNPCPLGSDFLPSHSCWLCGGAGVTADDYKAWIFAGRPAEKPEKWKT